MKNLGNGEEDGAAGELVSVWWGNKMEIVVVMWGEVRF